MVMCFGNHRFCIFWHYYLPNTAMRYFLLISFFTPFSAIAQAQIAPMPRLKTVMTLLAKDEKTRVDLSAHFTVEAILAKKKYNGAGTPQRPFTITLEQTDTLVVKTTAKGYSTLEEAMLIKCDTCADYEYVALLTKEDSVFADLKLNQAIQLDKVYFDQSSFVLRAESFPQLDKLAKTLATSPKLKIEIAGHTDNVGDRRLNQALSENRAKVIANYLVRRQIAENRLRHAGYGDSRPAAPNDSEDNKRKNRRVEFVVLAN